jgi:single-stranded DNA-binding protein
MNICNFTGFLLDDPELSLDNGVSHLVFKLITYEYRKSKSTGEKSRIPTILTFEAWHTGAETIVKLAQKGTQMTVSASARNNTNGYSNIVFRVNEFDFGCLNQE